MASTLLNKQGWGKDAMERHRECSCGSGRLLAGTLTVEHSVRHQVMYCALIKS